MITNNHLVQMSKIELISVKNINSSQIRIPLQDITTQSMLTTMWGIRAQQPWLKVKVRIQDLIWLQIQALTLTQVIWPSSETVLETSQSGKEEPQLKIRLQDQVSMIQIKEEK